MMNEENAKLAIKACDELSRVIEQVADTDRFAIHFVVSHENQKEDRQTVRTYSTGTMSLLEKKASLEFLKKDYE